MERRSWILVAIVAGVCTSGQAQSPGRASAGGDGSLSQGVQLDSFPSLGEPTWEEGDDGGTNPKPKASATPSTERPSLLPKASPSPTPGKAEQSPFQGPLWKQYFSPNSFLSYSAMDVEPVRYGNIKMGPVRMALQLQASAAYNSNVEGSSTNPHGDMIYTVTPRIALRAGTRGTITAVYQPSLVYFMTYKDQNSFNQSASLDIRYPFTKLTVGGNASYSALRGLFAQSGGIAELNTTRLSGYAEHKTTRKSTLRFEAEAMQQDSNPGGTLYDINGTLFYEYAVTKKLKLGPSLKIGTVWADPERQAYERLEIRGVFNHQSRWNLRFAGGVEARQYEQSPTNQQSANKLFPVFSFTLSYWPTIYSGFDLGLYRRVYNETFNSEAINVQTGMDAGFSCMITPVLRLSIIGAVNYIEWDNNGGQQSGSLWFASGAGSLTWTLHDVWQVKIFNNLQKRMADTEGNNYLTNVTGISVQVSF